jgi:hypothetical protein
MGENQSFDNIYIIWELYISTTKIFNKPCQCGNMDGWYSREQIVYEQRYPPWCMRQNVMHWRVSWNFINILSLGFILQLFLWPNCLLLLARKYENILKPPKSPLCICLNKKQQRQKTKQKQNKTFIIAFLFLLSKK